MTKTTSIVLLCLITVIALFFGVFAFILDGQPASAVNDYNSAYGLIQKDGMFGDTVEATYSVKLDEGVESQEVIKTLKTRLENIYSYYSVDISEKDGIITIKLPKATYAKTQNNGDRPSSVDNRILSAITQQGDLEILSSAVSNQLPTYSEDAVVLSQEHLRKATTRSYVNGENTYYVCQAKLTKEGEELVKKAKLSEGTTYCYAIDGTTTYIAVYQNNQFQIYGTSKENTKLLASIINHGSLQAKLTQLETIEVANQYGWIFAAAMGVVVLATFIFFAVRYKLLGLAGILSQLIVSVAFVYALAYIYMSMFNLFAAIGLVLAYAFMTFFTIFTFERIRAKSAEKTFATAAYLGFSSTNIVNLIAHGVLLVLGIIFWVIPTAVTAPMGTVLVFGAILSFAATFGLNRLFVKFVEPFYEVSGRTVAKK